MSADGKEMRPVTATFRVIVNGFAADLEATGTLEDLVGITKKFKALGITPGNSPLLWEGRNGGNGKDAPGGSGDAAPRCPIHGSPMKPSKKGSGFYCPRKLDDGTYCKEKSQ